MGVKVEVKQEKRGMWLNTISGTVSFGLGNGVNEVPAICIPIAEHDKMKAGAEAAAKVEGLEKELAETKEKFDKLLKDFNSVSQNTSKLQDEIAKLSLIAASNISIGTSTENNAPGGITTTKIPEVCDNKVIDYSKPWFFKNTDADDSQKTGWYIGEPGIKAKGPFETEDAAAMAAKTE